PHRHVPAQSHLRDLDLTQSELCRLRTSQTCRLNAPRHLEALCTPLDNESTQPLVTLLATRRWARSSEDQVEIRDLTVRNERLPAVNLPMGPMKLRSGLDPCYIGPGTRLRHSVGPDLLP